ncbi:CTQ-dependent lysine 6-oxidase LodA [Janthinobacterium fluminis]|uniref:CTQ-dependent lysine 6-oxidase LodA n=1 Tax=Janthinobacterium fluminis TaxID=2987524 RepID=A0ABT5K4P9_9BURK|nr:CTQ-dependent lysine 6-oxidase LodA [Janthinobacterium fluminis]MDC8758727.1 CTQ-dependent lysine 6-oxidase LodA [Janthinobacterium fluminis]
MATNSIYRIHPSIGVARVGNSPDEFYLAPDSIGGLPIEVDASNNPLRDAGGASVKVTQFKDNQGRVKRQAATFAIYRSDPANPGVEVPVDLSDPEIASIEWTVHLANKKAAWWDFVPLLGDLMFGPDNSYETWQNPPPAWNVGDSAWTNFRNSDTSGAQRQSLIIDPGPRTVSLPGQRAEFIKESVPPEYTFASFPDPAKVTQGLPVRSLGEIRSDSRGNLLVMGGFGNAGGSESITGFGGGDTWHDDIADGPVTARVTLNGGAVLELQAWAVIGSPKFAPELVNISTWDDVATDCALKYLGARPDIYNADRPEWADNEGWNPNYIVNYWQDIKPFLNRIADYQWVATVPSMTAFINPPFDPLDASEATKAQREAFLGYFRKPSQRRMATQEAPAGFTDGQNQQLFSAATDPDPAAGIPLMPLNSGTNSVRNNVIDKFSVLTDTQYYLLQQWARGCFSSQAPALSIPGVHPLDQVGVGNCVGEPMCPGIEVTWSVRNPTVYAAPFVIRHRHAQEYYYQNGLSWQEDETAPADWNAPTIGLGCEPGDLTKRMAIPWQADFFDCSVQFINFDNPNIVKDPISMIPVPPTYYAYWWPPQSPWNVLSGASTVEEQKVSGIPAGLQVLYSRGINSFTQMITAWKYLGFVLNQNTDPLHGRQYPYFVEKERNHDRYHVASVAVGNVSSFVTGDDSNFYPAWFLKDEDPQTHNGDTPRKLLVARRGRTSR